MRGVYHSFFISRAEYKSKMFLFRNKEFQILYHKQYESQRLAHQSYLFINIVSVLQSLSNVNEKHDDKKNIYKVDVELLC